MKISIPSLEVGATASFLSHNQSDTGNFIWVHPSCGDATVQGVVHRCSAVIQEAVGKKSWAGW